MQYSDMFKQAIRISNADRTSGHENQVVSEIIGCVDNVPDVLLEQDSEKVLYFFGKRIMNTDFPIGYVFVEKTQAAQSAGAAIRGIALVIF